MAKQRILIVDDEEDICMILSYSLQKAGYDTLVAHSAEEALELLQSPNSLIASSPKFNTIVFFRKESRPMCFFAPEEERILFSPATVEMAGIGIVANRESFDRLTPEKLRDIIREVAEMQYLCRVGTKSTEQISQLTESNN